MFGLAYSLVPLGYSKQFSTAGEDRMSKEMMFTDHVKELVHGGLVMGESKSLRVCNLPRITNRVIIDTMGHRGL